MAGVSLLLLSGDGSLAGRDRAGDLTATGVGALRYVTGKIAGTQAFLIEEATTNLVGNPWFGTNATGWTGATRTTTYAYQGVASGLVSATGANAQATYAVTVPATAHRLSAVVRNNAADFRQVQLLYNGALVGPTYTIGAGSVARLDAAITGTATSVGAGVRIINSVNGETFNVGHLQVEAKGYQTSETPALDAAGTILAGYTWSGTAHASTSTRSATTVTVDEAARILPAQGAAAMWIYRESLKAEPYILSVGPDGVAGTDRFDFGITANNDLRARWRTGTGTATSAIIPGGSPFVLGSSLLGGGHVLGGSSWAGAWHFIYTEWTGTTFGASVNGGALVSATRAAVAGTFGTTTDLTVGGNTVGGGELNGRIGPVMTYDRPLTAAEQSELIQRTAPWAFVLPSDPSRQAIPFSGGPKRLVRSMWRSNAANARLEDLTALVTGAGVSLDIDRTIPMTMSVDLVDPTALVAYRDFLAPVVTLTEIVSGTVVTSQVGLFRVGVPAVTRHPNAVTGKVDGEDMMSLLVNSGVGAEPLNVVPGDSYVGAINSQCYFAGVARTNFPVDARVVPAGTFHSWPPGTARSRIVFDICRILGWLDPWSDREGIITTKIVEEPGTQAPAITYRDGDGSSLVGVVTSQPAVTTLSNHIVVTQDNLQTGVVLTADRTNTDPSSPSSIPNIGERFRHESMTNAADQAAVNARADRLVEQWGNVLQNVTLSTTLDPLRGVWESADLAIHVGRADGGLVGRYRISGWEHDLSGGTTSVTLRRTEPFGKATQ